LKTKSLAEEARLFAGRGGKRRIGDKLIKKLPFIILMNILVWL
jgi:hypothetical protein